MVAVFLELVHLAVCFLLAGLFSAGVDWLLGLPFSREPLPLCGRFVDRYPYGVLVLVQGVSVGIFLATTPFLRGRVIGGTRHAVDRFVRFAMRLLP